jgi:PAS domain-containing protein
MTLLLIDSPKENRILAALSVEEYQRVLPLLEFVRIELGQVLYGSGDRQGYVYFPTTSIVSLVFTTENGSSAELAIVGNDGLVGIPIVLGGFSTTHQATAQSAGNAYRLRSEVICQELDQGGRLQSLALRYAQALMAQMAQSVVCNRHHTVDKQLCRWLLLSLDRLPTNQVRMTHDLIANMLGVRREGVTEAAGKLQSAGLISYSRGLITVIDRQGLEARVCECYSVIKKELDRLFSLSIEPRQIVHVMPQQETLRQRAELRLKKNELALTVLATDNAGLLHELQVHQIELEMQLEALNSAYHEANALRDRYADIYDFSPVGYFTLNADANILDLNLAGAILLGIKRSEKSRYRFNAFVSPEYLPEFNRFLEDVLKAQHKKTCEVTLLFNTQRAEATTVRIEGITDEDATECRMVVIDISTEKQAKMLQAEREQYLRTLLDQLPAVVWKSGDERDVLKISMLNAIPTEIVVIDKNGVILVANEQWQRFALENGVDPDTPAANTAVGSNYLSICQAAIEADSPGAREAYQGIRSVLDGQLPSFSIEYICPTASLARCFLMNVSPLGEHPGEGVIITHTDVTERKRMEQQLRQQALHDEVTHLPNYHLLHDRLWHTMEGNKRNGSLGALIYLGIEHCTLPDVQSGKEMDDLLMGQVALRCRAVSGQWIRWPGSANMNSWF